MSKSVDMDALEFLQNVIIVMTFNDNQVKIIIPIL